MRSARLLAGPAFVGALMLALPALAGSAGDLDLSFGGGDGMVTNDFGGGDSPGRLIALPNGKIVQVGRTDVDGTNDFAVARYRANGQLDATFSGDGRAVLDFNNGSDGAWGVARQGDKILVAGWAESAGGDRHFAAVRYRSNGTLDGGFGGGDGIVLTPFQYEAYAYNIVVLPDDSFFLIGEQYDGTLDIDNFAVARYRPNGGLDDSFGGDGKVVTDFAGYDDGGWTAIRTGNRLLVGGWGQAQDGDYAVALARYRMNGHLDTSFSGDGKKLVNLLPGNTDYAVGLVRLKDGRIVVGAYAFPDVALLRIKPNGGLDGTFSGDGKVIRDFGGQERAEDIVRTGQTYVLGGQADNEMATFRFKKGGAVDMAYGQDGMAVANFGSSTGTSIRRHDGAVVVGGGAGGDFALAQFLLN